MTKVAVAKRADVAPGTMREVEANGKVLVLANVDGRFWAMEGICSHRGGRLAQGKLIDLNVMCPVHRASYDVRTGKVAANVGVPLIGKASDLRVYSVSVEGEDVMVEVPSGL
jgi:nitrite reductase/ring-hydroxylating ferredoxin subunit